MKIGKKGAPSLVLAAPRARSQPFHSLFHTTHTHTELRCHVQMSSHKIFSLSRARSGVLLLSFRKLGTSAFPRYESFPKQTLVCVRVCLCVCVCPPTERFFPVCFLFFIFFASLRPLFHLFQLLRRPSSPFCAHASILLLFLGASSYTLYRTVPSNFPSPWSQKPSKHNRQFGVCVLGEVRPGFVGFGRRSRDA